MYFSFFLPHSRFLPLTHWHIETSKPFQLTQYCTFRFSAHKIARLEEENNKLKSRLKEYEENEDGTEKTARDYLTKYGVK